MEKTHHPETGLESTARDRSRLPQDGVSAFKVYVRDDQCIIRGEPKRLAVADTA